MAGARSQGMPAARPKVVFVVLLAAVLLWSVDWQLGDHEAALAAKDAAQARQQPEHDNLVAKLMAEASALVGRAKVESKNAQACTSEEQCNGNAAAVALGEGGCVCNCKPGFTGTACGTPSATTCAGASEAESEDTTCDQCGHTDKIPFEGGGGYTWSKVWKFPRRPNAVVAARVIPRFHEHSNPAVDLLDDGRFCTFDDENLVCKSCAKGECKVLAPKDPTLNGCHPRDPPERFENYDGGVQARATTTHNTLAAEMPMSLLIHSSGFMEGRLLRDNFQGPSLYELAPCTSLTDPCFDVVRCSDDGPMKVFFYRNLTMMINGEYDAARMSRTEKYVRDNMTGIVTVVGDPAEACLLFVESPGAPLHKLLALPSWRDVNGRNHFVWDSSIAGRDARKKDERLLAHNDGQFTYFNYGFAARGAPMLYGPNHRAGFDIVIPQHPVWKPPAPLPSPADPPGSKKYLVSYVGSQAPLSAPGSYAGHHLGRWLAVNFWEDADDVKVLGYGTKCRPEGSSPYSDWMMNSTFGYAPPGNGQHSYRFTEILSAGGIPVVAAESPLPFAPEISWSRCVVTVSTARIIDIPRIVRAIPEAEVKQRQAVCARMYNDLWGAEFQAGRAKVLELFRARLHGGAKGVAKLSAGY